MWTLGRRIAKVWNTMRRRAGAMWRVPHKVYISDILWLCFFLTFSSFFYLLVSLIVPLIYPFRYLGIFWSFVKFSEPSRVPPPGASYGRSPFFLIVAVSLARTAQRQDPIGWDDRHRVTLFNVEVSRGEKLGYPWGECPRYIPYRYIFVYTYLYGYIWII